MILNTVHDANTGYYRAYYRTLFSLFETTLDLQNKLLNIRIIFVRKSKNQRDIFSE